MAAAIFYTFIQPPFSALSFKHKLPPARTPRPVKIECCSLSYDIQSRPRSRHQRRSYDVFLSFRGEDIRNDFLSHLYTALDQKGVNTFVDSEGLRKGNEISPTLMKAIENSRIAVVLFSENYAMSRWCLSELVKIMECRALRDLMVKPVFYKVEPREVRHRRASYGAAMAMQEKKFGKYSKKVKVWRKTLSKAADLSGWHFVDGGNQADLVKEISKDILRVLNRVPLEVTKYPVGITHRVEEIRPLLRLDPPHDHGVHIIGILGLGGVGKTTLAKAVYNEISDKFDGCCFLSSVRETFARFNGTVLLQQRLLSELLMYKDFSVPSPERGIALIKERICCKRVLIVLDDVDHLDQLNSLAGASDWFDDGSRIIITTRDEHLLTSHSVEDVYRVQLLDSGDALELFCRHAFPTGLERTRIGGGLVNRILAYVNGLPLALVVLGTFLRGRHAPQWESTLKKLNRSPDKTINTILKISFDGLDNNEKEIFLDIACFFRGWERDYVVLVLSSCRLEAIIGLQILVERCLVTIEDGKVQMHDLLQVMGKDIVYQECPDNPSNRSRIWQYEDVLEVLSNDTVTYALKGIVLNFPLYKEAKFVNTSAFICMKRLRLLIVRGSLSLEGPIHIPGDLRWIEWHGYSAPTIHFNSPRKLVGLDFKCSNLKSLGGNDFYELKHLNLRRCESLEALPDISLCQKLEKLDLNGCTSLFEVHESVGLLENLIHLDIGNCLSLTSVPSTLRSKNFQTLNFAGCSKLSVLPEIEKEQQFLKELHLEGTAVKELPISIGNLTAAEVLNLNCCEELVVVPSCIYEMRALRLLTACNSVSLVEFLDKEEERPKEVPECPQNLTDIDFRGCRNLKRLPNLSHFLFQSVEMYTADFANCHGLVSSDINTVLSYEKVRRFVGYADMLLPGREVTNWMNFQSTKFSVSHQVSLPEDMAEDDVLGLAFSVTFEQCNGKMVEAIIGGKWFLSRESGEYRWESAHTWFVYIPGTFLFRIMNMRPELRVVFSDKGTKLERIRLHLMCRRKEDEARVVFRNCLTKELPNRYE